MSRYSRRALWASSVRLASTVLVPARRGRWRTTSTKAGRSFSWTARTRSSLSAKCRYSVPSAQPASLAISLVVALARPLERRTRSAASTSWARVPEAGDEVSECSVIAEEAYEWALTHVKARHRRPPRRYSSRLPSRRVKEHAAGRHDRQRHRVTGAMTEGRLAPEEVRTRTFTRVVRGYRRREVRRLLEQAAADLDRLRNGPGTDGRDDRPALTAEQVEEARFQPALGGYEMDEVDKFLDEVVAELERAAREPFRPASALPAPARQAPFPAAAKAPPPAAPIHPAAPPPPAPGPPAPPAPEPVASDEGFFPPPSVPPSAAPSPAPPPPPPPGPSVPRAPVATAS